MRFTFTVLIMLLLATSAHAEISLKNYKELKKLESAKPMLKYYIAGLGDGFGWANTELGDKKGKLLYCQPSKLALGADDYIKILDKEIDTEKVYSEERFQDVPIGLILLIGLQRTFPCN